MFKRKILPYLASGLAVLVKITHREMMGGREGERERESSMCTMYMYISTCTLYYQATLNRPGESYLTTLDSRWCSTALNRSGGRTLSYSTALDSRVVQHCFKQAWGEPCHN